MIGVSDYGIDESEVGVETIYSGHFFWSQFEFEDVDVLADAL